MKSVEIYIKDYCPYCHAAKRLLAKKGVAFTAIDIEEHPEQRATMLQRSNGGRTVPQIFIGGRHVGGSDDLHALESAGRLDAMLKG